MTETADDQVSVLLVEDDPLIAMMLEDYIADLGHQVAASVDTVREAIEAVEQGGFDIAIIDIQLRDGLCWPLADALADAGKPFMIATGGHVEPPPERHRDCAVLTKPYTLETLRTALEEQGGQG